MFANRPFVLYDDSRLTEISKIRRFTRSNDLRVLSRFCAILIVTFVPMNATLYSCYDERNEYEKKTVVNEYTE